MLAQLLSQLFDSFFTIGKDHTLRDNHVLVELQKSSELLTVFLKRNVELLDTIKGQLLIFDQNFNRILHEFFSHLNNLRRHGCREKTDLNISWQVFENFSDFVNKTSTQHLISFVENNDFKKICSQCFLFDQIFYSSRSSDYYLNTAILQSFTIFLGISSSDTASCINFKELAETENNFVNLLGKFSGRSKDDCLTFRRLGVNALEQTN